MQTIRNVLALASCLALSCATTGRLPDSIEVLHDEEYGRIGRRALHLEIARPKIPPADPMPVLLWLHGGGWRQGSHRENYLSMLATNGYFTASVEYRLSGEAHWPAQIEDVKLAVRWLRAHAQRFHINPDRIGVVGISSGGHLAACLGTMDASAGFDAAGGHTQFSSRVRAVVDLCGPVVFVRPVHLNGAKTDDAPVLVKLFGGTYREKTAAWHSASPIPHASPDDPPFLVIHGEADKLVSIEDSEELVAALHRAGVPVEFIRVKNGGHDLGPAWFWQRAEPRFEELTRRAVEFLDRHLKP